MGTQLMVFVAEDLAPSEEQLRPRMKKKRTARKVLLGVVAFFLVVAVGQGFTLLPWPAASTPNPKKLNRRSRL
ncbi:hypothetical protein [Arthrobacter sp. H16F315]|uniref:hypothetical protein n=1 Tax=Arthrobacter sp. H16F315 TaxID=2955314 RepID=UPI00209776A1|nr:hypothetical protein [Arthrobacter sp. H16F315]MDD1477249.1 hypothetical protein [Arthrobacter sp. H16F315]